MAEFFGMGGYGGYVMVIGGTTRIWGALVAAPTSPGSMRSLARN